MAIDLRQPFFNPITGESFRLIDHTEAAYVTEWLVQPSGFVPFEHVHVNQDEVFHVEEGQLLARVDGREARASAGETLIVPRGHRHIARNIGGGVLRCTLEYRPGLDTPKVFQCFAGLTNDGELTRSGLVHPFKMMYFMQKMRAQAVGRPASIPTPLFKSLTLIAFALGGALGWGEQYRRYTQ